MAVLEIRAARQFRHTDDLTGYRVPNNDPRSGDFDWDSVHIDLSRCEFVRPAAALWSLVYPLLVAAKGVPCAVEVPSDNRISGYLNDLGLFDMLRTDGVEVNHDRPINRNRLQLVLPLTRLDSITQVERLEEEILERLLPSNLSSVNVYFHVSQAFGELGNNSVEHPESSIGAYGFVQF